MFVGERILKDLEKTRVKCGFAAIEQIIPRKLVDRMETFFISETIKYLYLLFDQENKFNKMDSYVFNTEGIVVFNQGHIFPFNNKKLSKRKNSGWNKTCKNNIKLDYYFNIPPLPLSIDKIRLINTAVGLTEDRDLFMNKIIIPINQLTVFPNFKNKTEKRIDSKATWFKFFKTKSTTYNKRALDKCPMIKRNASYYFVNNNGHAINVLDQGPEFKMNRPAPAGREKHPIKIEIPQGVVFKEDVFILKVSDGLILNTLKDVQITLERNPVDQFYMISSINNIDIQENQFVKVQKSGILWLLSEKTPSKKDESTLLSEFESVLAELTIQDGKNKVSSSFSASVAIFGAALLPSQVLSAPLIPLFVNSLDYKESNSSSVYSISYGCSAEDYVHVYNTGLIQGRIIMIDRGHCSFYEKVQLAEIFGAIGVVVIASDFDDEGKTIVMSFEQDSLDEIGIIAIMVSLRDSKTILQEADRRRTKNYKDECSRLETACAPFSIIGETTSINDQLSLFFNNLPISNLLIIHSSESNARRWSHSKRNRIKDKRRRIRGRYLFDQGVGFWCLKNCLLERMISCKGVF